MNANIAKIASRTRMRLNGIRIPSISGVIPGPAPRCPTIVPLSTTHQLAPLKQILVGIVVKSLLGLLQVSRVWMLKLPWNVIERQEFSIWWTYHKFRECNHAKKFFRADHFRQHLKHSHAGTSGKWTNMLENACMKDEPLPEPNPGRITEEEEDRS